MYETPPSENPFCHAIFKFSLRKLQLKIIGNLEEKKERKRESNLSLKKSTFKIPPWWSGIIKYSPWFFFNLGLLEGEKQLSVNVIFNAW